MGTSEHASRQGLAFVCAHSLHPAYPVHEGDGQRGRMPVGCQVRRRFEEAGGAVLEFTAASGVSVHPNGVALRQPDSSAAPPGSSRSSNGSYGAPERTVGSNGSSSSGGAADPEEAQITGRLLIDCMGNFSPVVRQARWGQRPDGVCLVVGSCCRGFADNSTGGHALESSWGPL